MTAPAPTLLHGFAGTPAAWDEVLAAWPAGAPRPRAVALPGHGPSPTRAPATWDAAVDALAAAIDAAGGGGAPVVGYSLGARLALGLLARDLVPGAVLISVNPGLPADDAAARAARAADDARWAASLRDGGMPAFVPAWEAQPLWATAARAPADVRARRRAARLGLDAAALADTLDAVGLAAMPDLRAALAARAARAHLVVGALDDKFVAIARAAAAAGVSIEVIADAGHDLALEAPAATAAVIARALARWSAAG